MNQINRINTQRVKTSQPSPIQVQANIQPTAAPKKKSLLGNLFEKAGGAEGVLNGVSVGAAKGAQFIRNKKNGGAAGSEPVSFDAGIRTEDKQDTLFGMPAIAAYVLIGVIFMLVLFVVFKAAIKK